MGLHGPISRMDANRMDAKHSLGEPRILISRSALLHNAAVIRRSLEQQTRVCAILKADAYGHGVDIVADTLCNFSADGSLRPVVDAVAVASVRNWRWPFVPGGY